MRHSRRIAPRFVGVALGATVLLGVGIGSPLFAARADTAASNAAHAQHRYVIGVSGMT